MSVGSELLKSHFWNGYQQCGCFCFWGIFVSCAGKSPLKSQFVFLQELFDIHRWVPIIDVPEILLLAFSILTALALNYKLQLELFSSGERKYTKTDFYWFSVLWLFWPMHAHTLPITSDQISVVESKNWFNTSGGSLRQLTVAMNI